MTENDPVGRVRKGEGEGAREIRVEKEEWVCSGRSKRWKFEALNCFLKLSSSTRSPTPLSFSFFILVCRNLVLVAPFAFHFGMFNISFPYRSCKHVRYRGAGRAETSRIERSRAAKRVPIHEQRGKGEREREGQFGSSITSRRLSRFLHSKQLTLPGEKPGYTSDPLSHRFVHPSGVGLAFLSRNSAKRP